MKSILSTLFILGAAISPGSPPAVTPYPLAPGDEPNADFTVKVNGAPVAACGTVMNVGHAHFALNGTVKVEVTAREAITSFDVSPHRDGIQASAAGSTLSFELSQPRLLHIQVNKLPRLFLFADAPEAALPQSGVFDLTQFGVTSSAEAVQTAAIQHAIDEVAAKKGVLLLPPGIYRTGELRLKSHLTLHLAAGAILKGTGSLADHPVGESGTQLIHFIDCENVRIQGRGVIDGQGRALRLAGKNASASRSKLIRSLRARNIVVEDVILRDSGTWGVHLIESDHVRFTGVKLISNTIYDDPGFPWEANTDGFDPDNSSHVLIEKCFISSNDDSIAVKLHHGMRRDMTDTVFRDNVCWTVKSALKIGSEVYEKKLSNVRFENNAVVHADRGIVVYDYSGAEITDSRWVGNHFEFIGGDTKRMNIDIKIQDEEGKGRMQDVLLKDNFFEHAAEKPSRLQGLDAEHEIRSVIIENLVIAGKKCLSAEDARMEIRKHVGDVVFK